MSIEFLHTMVRVTDIDASLKFYCEGLGLTEVGRYDSEAGRFTLVFLASRQISNAAAASRRARARPTCRSR
jgi:catechol 2,3-dioxygenase-like lactoylglutathione lyase family enzyme